MEVKKIRLVRYIYYSYQNWINNHSYNLGKGNHVKNNGIKINSIIQFKGHNNILSINRLCNIKNTLIHIAGNNNKIIINEGVLVSGAELWIEDNDCLIEIGKDTFIGHNTHLACTENGSQITIGKGCMLSSNIQVRTGDSHSILDNMGIRINPAASVHIGNHCWLGEGCKVMKGVILGSNSVVSTGAIITKSFGSNVLLGGIPAKVLKENISWNEKRL